MGSLGILEQPQQPDISYAPDWNKYQARVKHRLENERLSQTLPSGFSRKLESDLVWEGNNLHKTYNWTYVLTNDDLEEIKAALQHFQSLNLPIGHVSKDTFPLSNLHKTLRDVSKELHKGHGFKVVRGVPVHEYNREENVIIYAGISSHIASVRGRQDTAYDGKPADVVLNHIKDLSATADKTRIGAPAYTADKQVFHTDAGDIVSLFALSTAAEGGKSRLASTWRVYNELAATRPDLLATLSEPWIADNFGRGIQPYTERPLLYYQTKTNTAPDRVVLQYARRYFTGFGALPRSSEIPPITEAQAEALDTLHFLGEKFNVGLDFRAGDIQYVNNLAVFHARDGFTDTADQRRHLVRLWLRDPEYAWETPAELKDRWAALYDGAHPENQVFPLEPFVRTSSNGDATKEKGSHRALE